MQTDLQTFPTTESSIQMTPLAVYRTASTQTISQTSGKSHTDPQNTPYSGFQNCPNVCMFAKDLGIVAQWMDNFLKLLLCLKLYHLDFSMQFKLCNLDWNWLFNELNKKNYHWGSFGTYTYPTI